MANIYSYETSEFQEIPLHPAPESCSLIENHTPNWTNITVAEEIGRGNKLREKKPLLYRRKEKAPISVNLTKTCSARKRRKRKSNETVNETSPGCSHWIIPPCSKSMKPHKTRPHNIQIKLLKKGDKTRRCSMRTAELAVPTKRHCIDTWRNKSYLLPELMVDRLKQQVLDLRPVVKIPDALYCFQRRKRRLHKTSSKNNITNKWKNQMPLRCLDTKMLCLIFAQKIILRLSTPWKLSLNSALESLYRVVDSDITQIANGKKNINTEYLERDRSIHSDITNKITLWIVGILEDLASKQLEEDLRDLDEEEGPVLDFLDDLVDHVLNLCPSVPSFDNNLEETSIHSSQDKVSIHSGSLASENKDTKDTDSEHFRNEIFNIINNLQDIGVEKLFDLPEGNYNVISLKEYFEVEIAKIINNFQEPIEEKQLDFPEGTNRLHFQNEINNLINNFIRDEGSKDEHELFNEDEEINSKYFENRILNIISIVCKESKDEVGKDDELQQIYTTETSLYQKGSVEMLSEDTDDRSKKVMFSISNMVNPHSSTLTSELTSKPHKQLQESQDKPKDRFFHKPNIIFGKPNEHLLSDADELWPNKTFSAALLRPSASVTKSITSLGKFSEDDENMLPLLNSIKSHEVFQNNKNQFSSTELHSEKLDIILLPDEQVTKSIEPNQTLLPLKEAVNEQLYFKSQVAEKLALLNEKQKGTIAKSLESQKLQEIIAAFLSDKCDIEVQTDQIKIPKVVLEATNATVISFESKYHIMDENVTGKDNKIEVIDARNNDKASENKKMCTEQENNVKLNNEWKVELETAPSWLIQTNAHGEPSEDFIPTQAKLKLTQNDIHKWCKDLDNGFKNLDIWRDWLQNTCQEAATLLKKKKDRECAVSKYTRIWRKLKNNVTKDAILWGKINRNTHETFECYRKYKANIKIVPSKRSAKCVCINTSKCNI